MATLSTPGRSTQSPDATSYSLTDRTRTPTGQASSPGPLPGDSPAVIAWKNALKIYRESLSQKELKRISVPTNPEDVVYEVEKWERKQSKSKYLRVASRVRGGIARLQRFSGAIDMLAQGSGDLGCLLWGSIRFVLVIVQGAAEEYQKLCSAIARISDCLPGVERYGETFLESTLVRDCIESFYVSILRFWTRACKFYRRHRFFNLIRVIWNDFDTEFGELEAEMVRNRDRVDHAALVEHIGEAKASRTQQGIVNQNLLEAQITARQKEITAWLAPSAYDVNYYEADLFSAKALQHPKTCSWILEKDAFVRFNTETELEESFLWVYAKPGAGKTVLSSFLIEHYKSNLTNAVAGNVFYFFCKNADADKNTSTAIIRSLLYQLYSAARTREEHDHLSQAIGDALDRSGQQRAVTFGTMWRLFSTHIDDASPITILIDALDECQDSEPLIDNLRSVAKTGSIKTIVMSRREAHLDRQLSNTLACEITSEDINADIAAFVDAKVSASSLLSNALVRDVVVTKLTKLHDGMFLWVYLMLEELKFSFSLIHVQQALERLPGDLSSVYKRIVHRLRETLKPPAFDLCSNVLMWVVSATRPLKLQEIKHALQIQYKLEGHLLLTEDGSFPYSVRDLELVCGSLITVRNGTLQVIHLTVKEFLRPSRGTQSSLYSDLHIGYATSSLQLTMTCLSCIQLHCARPIADLDAMVSRMDMQLDQDAVAKRRLEAPFLEYAMLSWLPHVMDIEGINVPDVLKAFRETFDSQETFVWAETCMTFQPQSLTHLIAGFDEIADWITHLDCDEKLRDSADYSFFVNLCFALGKFFGDYGVIVTRRPWEIYCLDLKASFEELADFYETKGKPHFTESTVRLDDYQSWNIPQTNQSSPNQLRSDIRGRDSRAFLIHDERRGLYFSGDEHILPGHHWLYVQNTLTGRGLPPAESSTDLLDQGIGFLRSYAMSPDGKHVCMIYGIDVPDSGDFQKQEDLSVIWQIDEEITFEKSMLGRPWAKVIFTHRCSYTFGENARSVVFPDNEYCLTPSGKIHLDSRNRYPLHHDIEEHLGHSTRGYYTVDGKKLFLSQRDENQGVWYARSFNLFENTPSVYHLCKGKESRMVDLSPSGRYLVLSRFHDRYLVKVDQFQLYDIETSTLICLPFQRSLNFTGAAKFHFREDGQTIIAFVPSWTFGLWVINVFVWDIFERQPNLQCDGKLMTGSQSHTKPFQFHVNNDETSALIVSETRSIQRIEVGTVVAFPNAPDVNEDFPYNQFFIAHDGQHLASLNYGKDIGHLQIFQIGTVEKSCRKMNLRWSVSRNPEPLCIAMSPDLKLLSVDADIFDLTNNASGSHLTPYTLIELQSLLDDYRSESLGECNCEISPCSSYIMFSIWNLNLDVRWQYPARLLVFYIDVKSKVSTMLNLSLPQDLMSVSAAFHPSQPMIILSYVSNADIDLVLEADAEEIPAIAVLTVNLRSLQKVPITFRLSSGLVDCIRRDWDHGDGLPIIRFATCGTFAFIMSPLRFCWYQVVQTFDIDPNPPRYLKEANLLDGDNPISSIGHSLISLKSWNGTNFLTMIKPFEQGFWNEDAHPTAYHDNVAFHSSRVQGADRFLLLGANDDVVMRILTVPKDGRPPEIKWLSLTFNEAKARLEADWQEQVDLWEDKKDDEADDQYETENQK